MFTAEPKTARPTPVETIRERWYERWAPMYVRLCTDVGKLKAGEIHPMICREDGRYIKFNLDAGLRETVQPGRDFNVLCWVYRG